MTSKRKLRQELRDAVQMLRRTPMPIADIAPLLQRAADALEDENEAALDELVRISEEAGLYDDPAPPPRARSKSQLRRFDHMGAKQFTCEFCGSVRDIAAVLPSPAGTK